jgi:hypothetical protein
MTRAMGLGLVLLRLVTGSSAGSFPASAPVPSFSGSSPASLEAEAHTRGDHMPEGPATLPAGAVRVGPANTSTGMRTERAITVGQQNSWYQNTYVGPWTITTLDLKRRVAPDQWRSAPCNQDRREHVHLTETGGHIENTTN